MELLDVIHLFFNLICELVRFDHFTLALVIDLTSWLSNHRLKVEYAYLIKI